MTVYTVDMSYKNQHYICEQILKQQRIKTIGTCSFEDSWSICVRISASNLSMQVLQRRFLESIFDFDAILLKSAIGFWGWSQRGLAQVQ